MKVREVSPNIDAGAVLAGAQFIDAFSTTIDNTVDARSRADRCCWEVSGRDICAEA
jgi:hypothetical protein